MKYQVIMKLIRIYTVEANSYKEAEEKVKQYIETRDHKIRPKEADYLTQSVTKVSIDE